MNRALIIGATGNVGRAVVSQLLSCDVPVRAMSRHPQAAEFSENVEVVFGDLAQPETLDKCLEGVDSALLVWTAPPDTIEAALDRITKTVRHVVFVSSPHKTPHPLFQQPNPLRVMHARIENVIENSAAEWTFLRPGMFASNALVWWAPQVRAGDVVSWPFADVPTAPIHPSDIAAVGVRALCDDGHAGAEYVLTGPQSLTHAEQVSLIGRAIGRSLRFEELSPDEARRELLSVMPLPAVNMLIGAWAAAVGHPAVVTSTVTEVTGRPPRTFLEWATDHAAEFQQELAA
jgi:uncharacterized protein YbjT (DUF2867 family)